MANPDNISDFYKSDVDKAAFPTEAEFRTFISDPQNAKDYFNTDVKQIGAFSNEKEFSDFLSVKKKESPQPVSKGGGSSTSPYTSPSLSATGLEKTTTGLPGITGPIDKRQPVQNKKTSDIGAVGTMGKQTQVADATNQSPMIAEDEVVSGPIKEDAQKELDKPIEQEKPDYQRIAQETAYSYAEVADKQLESDPNSANTNYNTAIKMAESNLNGNKDNDAYLLKLMSHAYDKTGNKTQAEQTLTASYELSKDINLAPDVAMFKYENGNIDDALKYADAYVNSTDLKSSMYKENYAYNEAVAGEKSRMFALASNVYKQKGDNEKADQFKERSEYYKSQQAYNQSLRWKGEDASTLIELSDWMQKTNPLTSGVSMAAEGIRKMSNAFKGEEDKYEQISDGVSQRVTEELTPGERVLEGLVGLWEYGMGSGSYVFGGGGIGALTEAAGAGKILTGATKFIFPAMGEFNLLASTLNTIGLEQVSGTLMAPVSSLVQATGRDMSDMSKLESLGMTALDLTVFMLLHNYSGRIVDAGLKKAGMPIEWATDKYGKDIVSIYNKSITGEPLTKSEVKSIEKGINEITKDDVEAAFAMVDKFNQDKAVVENMNKQQDAYDKEGVTSYRIGDKLYMGEGAESKFLTEYESALRNGETPDARMTGDVKATMEKAKEVVDKIEAEKVTPEEKPDEKIEPIRQLGTGSNVYYETKLLRVNDGKDGKVLLNVTNKPGEMASANIEFDSPKEAVEIAKKLNEQFPNGVPDALLIDKHVENLRKEMARVQETKPVDQISIKEEFLTKVADIEKRRQEELRWKDNYEYPEGHTTIPKDVWKDVIAKDKAEINAKYDKEIDALKSEAKEAQKSEKQKEIDRYWEKVFNGLPKSEFEREVARVTTDVVERRNRARKFIEWVESKTPEEMSALLKKNDKGAMDMILSIKDSPVDDMLRLGKVEKDLSEGAKSVNFRLSDLIDDRSKIELAKKELNNVKTEIEKINEKYETSPEAKTELDFTEKAKNIADIIRKGKIGDDIAMGTIPFAKDAWNGTLEVIAQAVEVGGKVADAIKQGVKYLKETEWYKSLSDKDKKIARDKLMSHFENIKELKTEYKPDEPTGKKVQKTTDASTGVKEPRNVITTSEKVILKDRIRNFARGVREGRKDVKEFITEVRGSIKDLRGRLSEKQISSIIARAEKIISTKGENLRAKRMSDFSNYVDKVISNENYNVDLSTANGIKAAITKKINSKSKDSKRLANDIDAVKAFLKISPNEVSDITEYNTIAKMVDSNLKRIKTISDGADVRVENDARMLTNKQISEYTQKQLEFIEQRRIEKIKEDYEFLANKNITLEEFKEIIDAFEKGDESAKEILDNMKVEDVERKREYLSEFMKYKLYELDDYSVSTQYFSLTPKEKATLDSIKKIDTSGLTMIELAKLNDVVNNITMNDAFDGSTYFKGVSDFQNEVPGFMAKVKKMGVDLSSIKNWFVKNVTSKDLLFDNIYKSDKVAAESKRITGVDEIYNKYAQAKNKYESVVKEYAKLKKELKIKNTPEERIKQEIYSFLRQNKGGSETEIANEYSRRKKWVEQSIQRTKESGLDYERRMGDEAEKAFESMKDAKSAEELAGVVDESTKKMSDFFIEKWNDILPETEQSARMDNNMPFEQWYDYTATKTRGIGGVGIAEATKAIDLFKQEFFNKDINSKAARTKISRTQSKSLPEGMVVDFDFASTQFDRMWETMYDNATSEGIQKLKYVLGNKAYDSLFGGTENKNIIKKYMHDVLNLQRGSLQPIPEIERAVTKLINTAQAKGVRMALGGVSQILKQPISVSANTVINMGKRPDLFFKSVVDLFNSDANDLMSKYLISQRGGTKAGYDRGVQLTKIPKIDFNNIRETASKLGEVSKSVYDATMLALTKSDVAAAKAAWMSYYKKYLVDNKIDFESWAIEKSQPNESAASYAEHMVSRSQNPNDATAMARLYQEGGRGFGQVLKNIVLPFSTFQVNQRMRMTSDVKKILYGSAENKAAAVKSLMGAIVEQAVFNAIKTYIIGTGITAGANALLAAYGIDEELQDSGKEKKFISNTLNDVFLSGFGSAVPKLVIKGANSIYSAATNDSKALLYSYEPKEGNPNFGAWGVYGVPMGAVYDMYNRIGMLDGTADMVTKGGLSGREETTEVELSPEEKSMVMTNFIVDALGLVGVSDADVLRLNGKLKYALDNQMKKKYGKATTIKIYSKPKSGTTKKESSDDSSTRSTGTIRKSGTRSNKVTRD